VRLTGSAARSAAEQGVSARISLTHTETTAGAVAIVD
jgi:phosphopantetheinyl transferase (holo-ACP synthase)